jgi:hypothetical protein
MLSGIYPGTPRRQRGLAADRYDQARLLGKRNECFRRLQPIALVLPSQKRLETHQMWIREGDERLKVEPKLSIAKAFPRLSFQLQLGHDLP